jgi:hypothetical protein
MANFRLFAANGKWKYGSLFSLVGKQETVIDDFFFGRRAHVLE